MNGEAIDPQAIRTLALLTGLDIPEEDLKPLAAAMRQHLASIAALDEIDLQKFDLTDVEPPLIFKAAWDE
jgi:hypothetical protein